MNISKLKLIIKNEYLTDVLSRSFWIATFIVPVLFVGFGTFGAYMMDGTDSLLAIRHELSGIGNGGSAGESVFLGTMTSIFLVLFLMLYGSQIFNKVKTEKINRIFEVMATCVNGRTMMLGKIIAVALIGLTQFFLWILLIVIFSFIFLPGDITEAFIIFNDVNFRSAILWSVAFFAGGYFFYGSLYAAIGAMTDRNNENQGYVAVLTFILLASFYVGEFAVSKGSGLFSTICSFVPFTAPSVGCVNAIMGNVPLWESVVSLMTLWIFAIGALVVSGKIYTSSMLLRGKRLTPVDILTFLHSK